MNKLLLAICLFAGFAVTQSTAQAQAPNPIARLYGASPFQDSLWCLDTASYAVIQRYAPALAGFTITGITGMAFDPTTYETYVIMKVSGVSGRVLGKINLSNGVCTQVGNLGDNFSTIDFREDGQLFGVTGDGAAVPETLYLIDKTTGAKTLAAALGAGADGEVICYNRATNTFFHWSGNGTVVMESVLSTPPYTATNIPTTGAAGGETFGALYLNPATFMRSTISSNFNRVSTSGVYTPTFGANPDDLRGLVMPPQFTHGQDTLCPGDTLFVKAGSLQQFDSIVCHWGDGTSDLVNVAGIASFTHVYATAGDYTVQFELDNGSVRDTFPVNFDVHINPAPVVVLSGNTVICSGDSVTISATPEVAMQWYQNGSLLSGATDTTYSTNVAGVYNVYATNSFGCSDSAAVGSTLIALANPVVDLGSDPTACETDTLAPNPAIAGTYVWNDNSNGTELVVNASGTYTLTITDTNGCIGSDTILVTINSNPAVDLSIGVVGTICFYDPDVTLIGTPAGGTFSGPSVTGSTFDPSIGAGTHTVQYDYTDANGCSGTDLLIIDVDGCAGVEEQNLAFNIFPNPSAGTFTLETNTVLTAIQIVDLSGKCITRTVHPENGSLLIDLSTQESGTYFMQLTDVTGARSTVKVIVTR